MIGRLLIVGVGSGSWEVRGRQLGGRIGANVTSRPTARDWLSADLCVLVKRAYAEYASTAASYRVPIVWDAVDFWAQPDENVTTDAVALAKRYLGAITPALTIGATQAMADDMGGVYLPHHARPGLTPAPIRTQARVVAYEGTPKYLGTWAKALEIACARLGLAFVINPPDLRAADIIVAFRGERWDGPICRRWKSGVKYVNALSAGRPVLTQASAAQCEIAPHGQVIEQPSELETALSAWMSADARQQAYEDALVRYGAYTLPSVARQYHSILRSALEAAA